MPALDDTSTARQVPGSKASPHSRRMLLRESLRSRTGWRSLPAPSPKKMLSPFRVVVIIAFCWKLASAGREWKIGRIQMKRGWWEAIAMDWHIQAISLGSPGSFVTS